MMLSMICLRGILLKFTIVGLLCMISLQLKRICYVLITVGSIQSNIYEEFNVMLLGNENNNLSSNYSDAYLKLRSLMDVNLNCPALFNPVLLETGVERDKLYETASLWQPTHHYHMNKIKLIAERNCSEFRNIFYFPSEPLSSEEADFPLAFVMLWYTEAMQVVQLLQALYWPQNLYCIHIDRSSSYTYLHTVKAIVNCLPSNHNVFFPKRSFNVQWGEFSVLQAARICLEELEQKRTQIQWKYAQIIAGTDFPLRTNREMVEIFKILNGSVDIDLLQPDLERFTNPYLGNHVFDRSKVYKIPPAGIRLYKGSFQASLPLEFVHFLLHDTNAEQFYIWLKKTEIPDEFFWSTLTYNTHLNAPGNFPGVCIDYYKQLSVEKRWITRYQIWQKNRHWCHGKFVLHSCVFGVRDLPILAQRPELYAHKLYSNFEPAARECLLQLHFNKTYLISQQDLIDQLDRSFYQKLPSVIYHNLENKDEFVCQ